MRSRTPVSIFPFLSVLLSTMGVLSFLAVTFMLFTHSEAARRPAQEPVTVRWVGAPEHVRPLLVECRARTLVVHDRRAGTTRTFTREALQREVEAVERLVDRAYERLGAAPSRTRLWLFLKNTIDDERPLRDSFTRLMHEVEIDNLSGESQQARVERYPILLVYSDAIATYDLASYLVETTTRLSVGLEPMLEGWELPYRHLGA